MKASRASHSGPGLGTRLLLFSSLFLLALPWLGYRYMEEMKAFLLQGQQDAQLLAAGAIATVLHNRSDLFQAGAASSDLIGEQHTLYVYPLDAPVLVDGYRSDWGALLDQRRRFGAGSLVYERSAGAAQPASFELLLGEDSRYLYGLVQVQDDAVVYRHPGYVRLDNSDHVRIAFTTPDGEHHRYVILAEAPGTASVYRVEADWKTFVSGRPVYDLSAIWRERRGGYDLEFRMPLAWLSDSNRLMLMVANVDNPQERQVDRVIATLPDPGPDRLNPLITRSPELDRILQGLGRADARICIVDRHRRVRAVMGGQAIDSRLCSRTDRVGSELVADALEGEGRVYHRNSEEGEGLIVAAQPVYRDASIIGVVLLEKNSTQILGMQRESLWRILVATLVVLLLAVFGLTGFGAWLAMRIRRLQRETAAAIDADGKVLQPRIAAESGSRDELGELSRSFSGLLSRLQSYTGFLETVPRMLRHEILNPVNTISLSLQQLGRDTATRAGDTHVNSAAKAVRQLELIVQSLTEAANIEDALRQDPTNIFDLAELVAEYVENSRHKHHDHALRYDGPPAGVPVRGSDLRIAQLLDKIKDNALDFAPPGSEIRFELQESPQGARLTITNEGPTIPAEVLRTLCIGMTSHRPSTPDRPHLGIGLYIAARIAQHHGGRLKVENREDAKGVQVRLQLPPSKPV